jgi:hypothetical protein
LRTLTFLVLSYSCAFQFSSHCFLNLIFLELCKKLALVREVFGSWEKLVTSNDREWVKFWFEIKSLQISIIGFETKANFKGIDAPTE